MPITNNIYKQIIDKLTTAQCMFAGEFDRRQNISNVNKFNRRIRSNMQMQNMVASLCKKNTNCKCLYGNLDAYQTTRF